MLGQFSVAAARSAKTLEADLKIRGNAADRSSLADVVEVGFSSAVAGGSDRRYQHGCRSDICRPHCGRLQNAEATGFGYRRREGMPVPYPRTSRIDSPSISTIRSICCSSTTNAGAMR